MRAFALPNSLYCLDSAASLSTLLGDCFQDEVRRRTTLAPNGWRLVPLALVTQWFRACERFASMTPVEYYYRETRHFL